MQLFRQLLSSIETPKPYLEAQLRSTESCIQCQQCGWLWCPKSFLPRFRRGISGADSETLAPMRGRKPQEKKQ